MDPKSIDRIFWDAAQIASPADQQAYLDQACGGDTRLRQQVAKFLLLRAEAEDFLESPPPGLLATVDDPITERPGTVIGPYKLLEQIGEGGFGVVFMAEQQEPIRRKVALKVIKPGMDTRQVIARFEAERQALALMDHPNIAKVLDAGSTGTRDQGLGIGKEPADAASLIPNPQSLIPAEGRPFFVMELVKGIPITDYCDQNQLTPRERLELFVSVCQAVQHAHQKGIIHRDIKPSNVLVTLQDGAPLAKVIDFGIAKAMGQQQLTDKTLVTGFAQMIGSPLYMAPEQAALSSVDVDTRSDIYSLGVLLYELLTGTTPFDKERLKEAGYDELCRIIREEEPPKPSTRLRKDEGERMKDETKRSEPTRWDWLAPFSSFIPHPSSFQELDWIAMKCLDKERNRRYETASALAADVQRYLHDQPVQAGPPGAGYRLRKFVKRNKGRVLAAAVVLLALLVGMAGTTWGMIRAEERAEGERRAKEEAQKRAAQVENAAEILASLFGDLDPQAAEKEGVALRALLSRRLGEAAQELEGEAVGDPLVVARLQHVLGISLRELGHLKEAEGVLVKAFQTRERLLGTDHVDTAATKHDLAVLYRAQGRYAAAERLYQEVLAIRTAHLGSDHAATLTTRHCLAVLYYSQGKYALAETLHKEVLALRTAKLGADHDDTLASQHWLALLYKSQGKYAQAEALYQEVLAIRTAKLGEDHLDTVGTKGDLAAVYRDQGKYDLAETLWKEGLAVCTAKLGADHPETLTIRHQLAILCHYQGNSSLAERLQKEVLALRTAKLGADHPHTLKSQHHLAGLYRDQGKCAEAEALYKEVLALRTAKLGAGHPHTLYSKLNLAGLYRSQKRFDLAIPLLGDMLTKVKLDPDLPTDLTLGTQADLGGNYLDTGRFADAIPLLKEAHQKGHEYRELAWVGDALLTAYVRAGTALLGQKKYADAEPYLLQGYEEMKERAAETPKAELTNAMERLIELYDAWGKKDKAAEWRKKLEGEKKSEVRNQKSEKKG